MLYERPTCQCGETLSYVEEVTEKRIHDITLRGKKAKKPKIEQPLKVVTKSLECLACGQTYAWSKDHCNRISLPTQWQEEKGLIFK